MNLPAATGAEQARVVDVLRRLAAALRGDLPDVELADVWIPFMGTCVQNGDPRVTYASAVAPERLYNLSQIEAVCGLEVMWDEGEAVEGDGVSLRAGRPKLERLDGLDARLVGIKTEQKTLGGLLPKSEVADRLVAFLRHRREQYARRDVVVQLSGKGRVQFNQLNSWDDVLDLVLYLIGPQVEGWARNAVASAEYAEGPSSAERARRSADLEAERTGASRRARAARRRRRPAGPTKRS